MDGEKLYIDFDENTFSKEAVLRACYQFDDQAYFDISRRSGKIIVQIICKEKSVCDQTLVNDIKNSVIDHDLRITLEEKTRPIKVALIQAALKEAGV